MGLHWLALWEKQPDDDLRDRGRKWLDEVTPEHGSWGHVWLAELWTETVLRSYLSDRERKDCDLSELRGRTHLRLKSAKLASSAELLSATS